MYEKRTTLLIFIASLVIFTVRSSYRPEFLMIDSRFALFVHEMIENQNIFIASLYGKIYPDYLGLPTFLSALTAWITGKVNYFSLILPSAAAASFLVVMTWKIGLLLFSPRIAATAVLLLFGAYEFVAMGRCFSLDFYPAAVAAAGVWFTCSGLKNGHPSRVFWTLPLLILGYAARGPIGAVVPTAVICTILLFERKFAKMLIFGICAVVITLICLAAWGYMIYHFGGMELLNESFFMQVTHRLSKGKPFWYYFTNAAGSYAIAYPIALAVMVIYIIRKKKQLLDAPEFHSLTICMIWFLTVAIGFSIPGTKHLRYVAPLFPAMALLAAHLFWNIHRLREIRFLRKIFFSLASFLPFLAIPAFIGAQLVLLHPWIKNKIGTIDLPVISGTVILILFDLLLLASGRFGKYRRLIQLAVIVMCVVFVRIMIIEPVETATMGCKDFVEKCEKIRGNAAIGFYALGPDGDENKYMVNIERNRKFLPFYLQSGDLKKQKSGTVIVARMDRWDDLPEKETSKWQILEHGNIGRRKAAMLRKK